MKKVLLSLAAVSAIATVATPAAAQPWYGRDNAIVAADHQMNQREARISRQIERLERRHVISAREEHMLRRELASIEIREKAYRRSGGRLTRGEIADIHARLDRLEGHVQYVRNNGGSQYGYGYGYGYDRDYDDRW